MSLVNLSLRLYALMSIALLALPGVVSAAGVAQAYISDDTSIKVGMVVALIKKPGETLVTAASTDNSQEPIGAVVSETDTVLASASERAGIYVVTTGEVRVYVSDINGDIKKGDILALSSLKGVLQKASETSLVAAGIAQEDLSSASLQTITATDKEGKKHNYKAGRIKININQGAVNATPKTSSWLENIGRSVTGNKVSAVRVLAAMVVFSITLIIIGSIVFGIVTASTAAVGRNPLAKKSISRQSLQSSIFALMILFSGAASIILILWV